MTKYYLINMLKERIIELEFIVTDTAYSTEMVWRSAGELKACKQALKWAEELAY